MSHRIALLEFAIHKGVTSKKLLKEMIEVLPRVFLHDLSYRTYSIIFLAIQYNAIEVIKVIHEVLGVTNFLPPSPHHRLSFLVWTVEYNRLDILNLILSYGPSKSCIQNALFFACLLENRNEIFAALFFFADDEDRLDLEFNVENEWEVMMLSNKMAFVDSVQRI